jgi:amidase
MSEPRRHADPSPRTAEVAALGVAAWQGAAGAAGGAGATSQELVEALLQRIGEIDRSGPELRSVIAVDEACVERAAELDEERRAGRIRGPLHGVAVLLKDNIDTTGTLATTAGSLALADPRCQPAQPATVVRRLVDAGAVVVGKANLSEWANFRSRHSSSGWSAVGGQCRNPHVLDRSPGGSSAGSGAAVAAGLAPLAIGTETDGSILCPATVNGVVGIKPTVGLVPRTGVVPISASQDTVGPMARSVADAAALLAAISGDDGLDPAASGRPAGLLSPPGGRPLLDPDALAGARIGVARAHCFGYSAVADGAAARAIELMAEAGAEIVDPADIETVEELSAAEDELVVLLHEFKAGLEAYLATRPGPPDACPRTLEELAAFDAAHADRELAFFGDELILEAAATGGLEAPAYLAARARCLELGRDRGLDATLARHRLDAIVAPTMGPAWCIDHVNGDSHTGACYQAAAVSGYPAISIPAGRASGLPLGVCLMGPAWSEARLIGLAYALEQRLGYDPAPSWLPTAPW